MNKKFPIRLLRLEQTGDAVIEKDKTIITIVEDDNPAIIEFTDANYSNHEIPVEAHGYKLEGNAVIFVKRTENVINNLFVDYTTITVTGVPTDRIAAKGADYDSTAGRLFFSWRDTGEFTNIRVSNDLDMIEKDEYVKIVLTNTSNNARLGRDMAVLTIKNGVRERPGRNR